MRKNIFLRKKRGVICFVILAILFSWTTCGYCAKIKSFSADQVSIDPSGKELNVGKLYMTPDKIRMDMQSPKDEGNMIMIFRKDRNVHWMLNPKDKKYFERLLNEEEMKKALNQSVSQNEEILGTETVNGFKCLKKRIETTVSFMGIKRKSHSTIWVSNKLEMPIRTKSKDGHITELRNIKPCYQTARLFKIPDGYQKVPSIIELYGNPSAGEKAGESDQGSADSKDKGSFFKLPKSLSEKLPKGIKWPFGDKKEAGTK